MPGGFGSATPVQPTSPHAYSQVGYQQAPYGQATYAQAPYGYDPYVQPGLVLVGFGPRLLAQLIDGVILAILYWVADIAAGSTMALIITSTYFIASWGIKGQTIGKMALGLKVVAEDGTVLDLGKASIRYFAQMLSALLLGIGFIMIAFDGQKRGLHDMIAKTRVVKSR